MLIVGTVKELNRKIVTSKEEAQVQIEKMKNLATAKEKDVQSAWKCFQEQQVVASKTILNLDGQPLPAAVVGEQLAKIDAKLEEWRKVGMKGALIMIRKEHLEARLRALVTLHYSAFQTETIFTGSTLDS